MTLGKPARPVRILDTRCWTSCPSFNLDGFQWHLNQPDAWKPYQHTVGMACLYWSNTGALEPDPQALLDFPWEPLPPGPDAAGAELTRRAHSTGPSTKETHGSWLCLSPIARGKILCPWAAYDYEQMRKGRELDAKLSLRDWEETNRRLTALDLDPVTCDPGGHTAPFTREQIMALLDRAEQQ
ncbi:hypothetical protein ACFV42_23685 [Streptomyces solisilvae]|uniref:hypothetical protein n=1 Tax=Streptomyces malaysiensis TaxID=92644 RepID=UPI0036CB01F1